MAETETETGAPDRSPGHAFAHLQLSETSGPFVGLTQAKEAAASEYSYRLAVDAAGNHGYEIGKWKANADLNNPGDFIVAERCYDQQEAFLRANALTLAPPPDHLPPEEGSVSAEPEAHGSRRHRK